MNKITFKINVNERDFIEHCLKLYYSGYDPTILLTLYALGKHWHFSKLLYYRSLMKEENE